MLVFLESFRNTNLFKMVLFVQRNMGYKTLFSRESMHKLFAQSYTTLGDLRVVQIASKKQKDVFHLVSPVERIGTITYELGIVDTQTKRFADIPCETLELTIDTPLTVQSYHFFEDKPQPRAFSFEKGVLEVRCLQYIDAVRIQKRQFSAFSQEDDARIFLIPELARAPLHTEQDFDATKQRLFYKPANVSLCYYLKN